MSDDEKAGLIASVIEAISNWGLGEWGLAIAVLAYLGFDLKSGWKGARWLLRGFKSAPQVAVPVYVVPEPNTPEPTAPGPTPITYGIPLLEREVRGREDELAQLRAGLLEMDSAAIVNGAVVKGYGGVGKSTMARYYIEQFGDGYGGVFWGRAQTQSDLIADLQALALDLKFDTGNKDGLPAAKAILAHMAGDGRNWLFVYDNVDDAKDIAELLPQSAHLIITTRQNDGWQGFARLDTDSLDYRTTEGAAVAVLMEAAERNEDANGARDLAEKLGGLPLALIVAGAFIRTRGGSFGDYLTQVDKIIKTVPKDGAYPDSVIGAVRISYEKLGEDAQAVADVLAWVAPDQIDAGLLTEAPQGAKWQAIEDDIRQDIQALVQNPERVREALAELCAASLLQRDGDVQYDMHRMTSAALRAGQDWAAANSAAALLAAVYPGDVFDSQNWPLCRRLTPHVRAMAQNTPLPATAAMGYLLTLAGVFLDAMADYYGGLAISEAGFALTKQRLEDGQLPEGEIGLAANRHNLAIAKMRMGDLDGAEADMGKAIALEEEHRPETEDLAVSYAMLGGIIHEQARQAEGKARKALLDRVFARYDQALEIREKLFGAQSQAVATTLNNMATAHDLSGNGEKSAELSEESLDISRKVLPDGDARLATGCMNTGAAWLKAGKADQAEDLLQEALKIWQNNHGEDSQHPDLRGAADWLISCLLVRANAGENTGVREIQAKKLAAQYGFDWDERVLNAKKFPYKRT